MGTFTNNSGVPKAVITVDGPIILKSGETSKDVSEYKFTDDYVNMLAAAGVSFAASVKKAKAPKAKLSVKEATVTLEAKD